MALWQEIPKLVYAFLTLQPVIYEVIPESLFWLWADITTSCYSFFNNSCLDTYLAFHGHWSNWMIMSYSIFVPKVSLTKWPFPLQNPQYDTFMHVISVIFLSGTRCDEQQWRPCRKYTLCMVIVLFWQKTLLNLLSQYACCHVCLLTCWLFKFKKGSAGLAK